MKGIGAFLLEHPVLVAIGLFAVLGTLFNSIAGRAGAALGLGGAWTLLTDVDKGWLLRIGDWLAQRVPVALAGVAVTGGVLWFAQRRIRGPDGTGQPRPIASAVNAGMAMIVSAVLSVVVIFGVAWGSRGVVFGETSVPVVLQPHDIYVALGDSYSAGEGLGPYMEGTDTAEDNCHRSVKAFVWALTFGPEFTGRKHLACSGARSADILNPRLPSSKDDVPPQLADDLLSPRVTLVTITIGGNDVHFSDILEHCFRHRRCLETEFRIPNPDANDEGLPPPAPLEAWADRAFPVIEERLVEVFAGVRSEYQYARVVALGYPQLFPTGDRALSLSDCDAILRQVDVGERAGLAKLQREFNATIYRAAADAGIEFIDPTSRFSGHEACGVFGPMINSARLVRGGLDRGAFHPTATGQRVLARLVSCYLNQYPTARDAYDRIDLPNGGTLIRIRLKPAPGTFMVPIRCPDD